MHQLKRKLLSQNFLRNPELATKIVEKSSIGKNDLVLEIGPGNGILTLELLKKAGHVMAVELDQDWVQNLRSKYFNNPNLTVYHEDFLNFTLPKVPYKVFANIPFSIEGKIIRKLIDSQNPPEDCYLVIVKELANRLSGGHKENQFSLIHKPWFKFSILHYFSKNDFFPHPNVDAVLWRFTKRASPLLPIIELNRFTKFIEQGFGNGLPLFRNLRDKKIQQLLSNYGISKRTLPNELNLDGWIKIYKSHFGLPS